MTIPATFHTPFGVHKAVGAGATVEAVAAATGIRLWVTGISVDITTAGAAGTTVTVQEKSGGTDIVKCDSSAVGQKTWWFGERGYPLTSGQGIEIVNGAAVVSEVNITGYKEKP